MKRVPWNTVPHEFKKIHNRKCGKSVGEVWGESEGFIFSRN
jgi:hypothetical protein